MASKFTRLMPHQMMTETPSEIDRFGHVIAVDMGADDQGATRTYRCRIQGTTQAWRGADPSVSVSAKIFVDASDLQLYGIDPKVGDLVTLSDYWGGRTYTILHTEDKVGLDGVRDHLVVWVE
jgi:hypothetical protein